MAKVKYDVSKAEVRSFETPKPGVYTAHIHEMEHGDSSSGNPMLTVVFELTDGEFKGSRIWYYILTDGSQDWRLREFTDALGLKSKGEIDTDALKGTVIQLRTGVDPAKDGFDEKARVKNVLPAGGSKNGATAEADEEEPPYDEWPLDDLKEEIEARELKVAGKATKQKLVKALEADDAEAEEEEEEPEAKASDEDEEEDITRAELDEMDRDELKALIKDEELEIRVSRSIKDDALRDKIAEALELEEEEEEEAEPEEEEEGDYTMAELNKLDRAGLRKLIKDEELDVAVSRRTSDDRLREKVAEALEIGEEEEEETEEKGKDTDYEEWDLSDLKGELKERGLKTDGRKSVLVARLKKDDASDDEPF